jgi:hypothetical protein
MNMHDVLVLFPSVSQLGVSIQKRKYDVAYCVSFPFSPLGKS